MLEDITQWLRAQLDGDERIARDANTSPEMVTGIPRSYAEAPVAVHISTFADTTRVLREIDAKRRIAELHDYYRSESLGDAPACFLCGPGFGWPCPTMRALALPYADRSGYREEWRP